MFAFFNVKEEDIEIKKGDSIGQAIFQKYYVVDNDITDNAFTALIKKYCGVDVISAINMKHQAEEN